MRSVSSRKKAKMTRYQLNVPIHRSVRPLLGAIPPGAKSVPRTVTKAVYP